MDDIEEFDTESENGDDEASRRIDLSNVNNELLSPIAPYLVGPYFECQFQSIEANNMHHRSTSSSVAEQSPFQSIVADNMKST